QAAVRCSREPPVISMIVEPEPAVVILVAEVVAVARRRIRSDGIIRTISGRPRHNPPLLAATVALVPKVHRVSVGAARQIFVVRGVEGILALHRDRERAVASWGQRPVLTARHLVDCRQISQTPETGSLVVKPAA